MEFTIENGADVIAMGYSELGSYLRIKKPVSLVWYDCMGSVGQYLCMMPCSDATRDELQKSINYSLYEDFTGREEQLHKALSPLISLFQSGEYNLFYGNGSGRSTKGKIIYPDVVDLNKVDELMTSHQHHSLNKDPYHYDDRLIYATTTMIYDSWGYLIATRPLTEIDADRVKFFEEEISAGKRPFVILIEAFYQPARDYTNCFILDGHHKLQAYENLGIDPPIANFTRVFKYPAEAEFDLETLANQVYKWQTQHIVDNWEDDDGPLPTKANGPDSPLHKFYRNGLIQTYHKNGQLSFEGHYLLNKLNGAAKSWHENGNLMYEFYYQNGLLTGDRKYYHPSGNVSRIIPHDEKHLLHGEDLSFYDNGQMLRKEIYEHGHKKDGVSFQYWHENGTLGAEHTYRDRQIIEEKQWNDRGELYSHRVYDETTKELTRLPVLQNVSKDEIEALKRELGQKKLNIIRERQYPETKMDWRLLAMAIFLILQLLRMC